MLVDTHAHLWWSSYKDDLEEVLARAKNAGVEKMIVPGTNIETSKQAIELAKKYPGVVYAAVGIHPEEGLDVRFQMGEVSKLIETNREWVVATGEIGMDMSSEELRAKSKEQAELLRKQCELALENDLPVIIHTRQSLAETLAVLDQLPTMPRGQFHCFSHDPDGVREVLTRGFWISFGGNISWSKRVARLIKLVPSDKLLLETDSPLMVPRDQKGRPARENERNEPANVRILAQIIAEKREEGLEVLAGQTTQNAAKLFKLK